MKTRFLIVLFFISFQVFSQDTSLWQGYFSYNNISDISQSGSQIYAAAENAYFKRNVINNETAKFSTIDGLSGKNITQIYHSEIYKKTIIGHVDGLITVVNDTDGSMLYVVDIMNKVSVPSNMKRINHFMEYNGKIYIATNFGISLYDLKILEFSDTYVIGPNGTDVPILQTTVFNNIIYAVAKGYGILKANVSNTNLIDYNQWTNIYTGNASAIQSSGSKLIATVNNQIYDFTTNTLNLLNTLPQTIVDLRYHDNHIIITTPNYVYVYDNQLQKISELNNTANISVNFTCATTVNNKIYIGTQEKGLLATKLNNPATFDNLTANGPDRNRIFAIKAISNGLWAAYGDYDQFYNPFPLDSYGVSKLDENKEWRYFPYENIFNAMSIVRIIANPANENEVYFSSHFSGLLKFENDIPTKIYKSANSSLQAIGGLNYEDVRTNGTAYDNTGNLWITNTYVNNGLQVLRANGQWQGYKLNCIAKPAFAAFGRIAIDKNGTKWITTFTDGLIAFNEKYNNKCIQINEGAGNGNLPNVDVRAIAVDNKNKLWVGTKNGLRILPNTDVFLTQSTLETNNIVILEDGVAQELLFDQYITDIVVDGSNNKWIGTAGSGVFYISADGQKTFHIFTTANSPLPNNTIIDIDINNRTGEVFIATEGGMVSYKGNATTGAENLNNVIAFPNPVRPEYNGEVIITGLMEKSNVKITDIEGNLVYEAISEGGSIQWDTTTFSKNKVASGVYVLFISSQDGAETKVKKVMIIR